MADKKISALTGATTPLAGTEVLPIVQGGNTVKVSVANLTAGRSIATNDIVASGELTSTTNNARISRYRSTGTNYFDWASGQTLAFGTQTSQGGAGRVSKVNFLDNGDVTNVTGNFVVGTAGKGIADSAGNLKLAITTTSVAASSVLSGGLTHRLGTYSAGETTPSVTGVSHLDIANASPTTIANFTGAVRGQMLLLLFRDGNTTITRANAYLAGAVDFTSANRATLLLMSDGSFWYEVCRSTTNG